jgi:hypothetical protein
MLKRFKEFPEPLQKQILLRIAFAIVFVFAAVLSILSFKDWSILAVGAAIIAFCAGQAIWLFRLSCSGRYVVISGECCEMTLTHITRRIKSLLLRTIVDDKELFVRIPLRHKMRKLPPGTVVHLYTAESTLAYEKDGAQQINGYLAIDLKGRRTENEHSEPIETGGH